MRQRNPFDFGRVNGKMLTAFAGTVLALGVCLMLGTLAAVVLFSLPAAPAIQVQHTPLPAVESPAQPSLAPTAAATLAATRSTQNLTPAATPQSTPSRAASGQPTSAPATATSAGPGPRATPTFNWQQAK